MCGTKAFRGLPESDSCVHFRTQARTGVSAPVKPASPRSYNLRAVRLQDTGAFLSASSVLTSQPRSASSTGSTAWRRLSRWLVSFPRMRFLTLAFDLFNSRQSFYICCPVRDTASDSLERIPRYISLHHPLANVSNSRGPIRYSEGAFFGCTCFSKGGCFPLKSTIPRFDMIGHWERQYREGGLDALSWGSPSRHNKMKKNQSPEATSQSSKNDARSREELLEELNFFRMENADLKKLEVLAQTKKQAAHESERKSCLS